MPAAKMELSAKAEVEVEVDLRGGCHESRPRICHVGVVIHYLMKFTKYAVYVFNHQRQTSLSGCHSDDEFCIGQEDRLFNEADVLHEKL